MDLQLAYLAAPQNAAQVSHAQAQPQQAAQAAQAAFIAQLEERSESVAESSDVDGEVIRPDGEDRDGGRDQKPRRRRGSTYGSTGDEPVAEASGEHFIDVSV